MALEEFEVGNVQFRLSPLKVHDQLALWPLIAETILPAMVSEDPKEFANAGVVATKHAEQILSKFAAVTKVTHNGNFVPLQDFVNVVFERKPAVLLGYLTECLVREFGPLLDESGRSILKGLGARFASRMVSTG